MSIPKPFSVVAVFAKRGQAEASVDQLWHEGFPKENIGLATHAEPLRQATTATEETEETAADGAVMGALQGTTLGALAGALATATIPGVGVVIGGGLLASIVMGAATGAAAGAALGGFAGPFVAMGLSEEAARGYESHLRAGRTIVGVHAPGEEARVLAILRSHAPLHADAVGAAQPTGV